MFDTSSSKPQKIISNSKKSSILQMICNSYRGGYADYIGDDDDDDWDDNEDDDNAHHMNHPSKQQQYPPLQSSWGNANNDANSNDRDGPPSLPQQQGQYPPPHYGHPNSQQNPYYNYNNNHPHQQNNPQIPPHRGGPQSQSSQQQHQQQQYNQQQQNKYPPQHQHQYQNEQQQHQQSPGGGGSQYPPPNLPPPNLPPGYGAMKRGALPQNRMYQGQQHQGPPPGFDYEQLEEEEVDDWLPPSEEDEGEGIGGIQLPNNVASQSSEGSGNPDLSAFDKDVIFSGLKRLYRKKIRPLELSSKYGHFHSPPLSPSDFDSKPMVLLLGQYSVGKTSFIRYLLGRDFPGQRIGPEPTTDRFVAIIKGESGDKIIPGAALCSQADRPFRGLSPFGNNFLSRFEGVEMDSPILNNITLVDTPGILSGQKQSIGRNYDYEQVMKWFAERADLIIIMFDAHKLDISDELKRVIEILKPHQDKMRVLLNKADAISTQQLMRVYGALMWSLGKVMMTPEVCRVYMGSFWGAPLKNKEQATLLNQEKQDLFNDIAQLPQNAVMRRINELVKRARSVKVHAYIIHYLRKQLPYTWGKREKQRRLIDRLEREFVMCARRYELPRGDFPELEPFRQALLEIKDLSEVHKLDKKMVKEMDKVFSVDIPNLLEQAKFH